MADISLRERNKAKRRDAIVRAAFQLFADMGYQETTIPDIAELAEVSTRTVSVHFPAKMDIVRDDIDEGGRLFGELFANRAPGATILDVAVDWLQAWLLDSENDWARHRLRMYDANEELGSLLAARIMDIVERAIQEDPALRSGLGHPGDRFIVGAALAGLIRHLATVTDRKAFESDFARIRIFLAGGAEALRTVGASSAGGDQAG